MERSNPTPHPSAVPDTGLECRAAFFPALKRRATLRMSLRDKGTWRQPFQPSKQPDSLASLQGHFAATLSRQEDVGKDYVSAAAMDASEASRGSPLTPGPAEVAARDGSTGTLDDQFSRPRRCQRPEHSHQL